LFLAAASHDLRQPLYAISLFADALTDEPMTKGGSDTLEKQRRAIAALRTLFDNLLDLSRFDAGEVRPVYRNVSLREILLPIAQEYEMVCASKNLKCRWEILDVWVNTDAELLRRVVRNLLSNAVRYTTTGEIQMVALVDGSKVTLQVIDTGIGIAPEDQGRIFDEFVQLDNPARERDKGVGLGLSIVKRISDLIGAGLRLDSRLGSGTTVSLDLPVVAAEAVAPTQVPVDDFSDMAGLTVWVVEDDPAVQSGLAKLFDSWRMRHRIVSSRKELMRLRESGESLPDAVILDDMLGSGDGGLEIAQWLRTFIPEERIVLVTGNVNDERTRQLEASGLVVLRKPLAASDLAQWLRDATAAAKAS
jgi:CheY-like chemotaxis protein